MNREGLQPEPKVLHTWEYDVWELRVMEWFNGIGERSVWIEEVDPLPDRPLDANSVIVFAAHEIARLAAELEAVGHE